MDQVSKYGIVDCDNVEGRMYMLKGMVEKPKKKRTHRQMLRYSEDM